MSFRDEIDKLIGRRADMLTKIIVINVIVFLLANIVVHIPGLGEYVYSYLALPSSLHKLMYRPWTLITYMFLHVETMHLIFNMLWFYWFGIIFTDFMGAKRLLYTYLLGGIAGGLLFIIFSNIFMPYSNLLGASAGIMAVIVATAILVPDYELRLIFFGPVKLKYLAAGAFILTSVVDFSVNSGGKVSHIGGALYGMFYMLQYKKGTDFTQIVSNFLTGIKNIFTPSKKGTKIKKSGGSGFRQKNTTGDDKQKKIDAILDKISASGYDALTREEKDFLFKSTKGGGGDA
jgi:membrane associated rhomboid family serine protease